MKMLVSLSVRTAPECSVSASKLQQSFVERCLAQLKSIARYVSMLTGLLPNYSMQE